MKKKRADQLLVERGLAPSRARARAAIEAGFVTADGEPVKKAAQAVADGAVLRSSPAHPYVSRGGLKLAAALDRFGIDPKGKICLDVGASTGGFSEVLLSCEAARVYAVDVGHDQLHPSLHGHERLVSLEATDARVLDKRLIPEPVDLLAADVSFISLKLVLPATFALCAPAAALVVLVKPQFEAGRDHVKKGIVRDEKVQAKVCAEIARFIAEAGWTILGQMPSPVAGGDGNREFLIGARRG
ncbi:MAG TPA: TlyA family RNA methyltransferase [Xanthobacteraceae bacterium]|nr:TlyA family RNA methyltransferase [Xanthobacteraceae bacterium]